MGAKIRKQIYIEADQESRLKQLASLTNLSEAEIIRQAIDQRTQSLGSKRRNLAAWQAACRCDFYGNGMGISNCR